MVKAKFSEGGVTADNWNKFVNPITAEPKIVNRPEKTGTNGQNRPYNTYSDLANQHHQSQMQIRGRKLTYLRNKNKLHFAGHSTLTEPSCEHQSHAFVEEKYPKAESQKENNFIKRNTYINKFGDEVDCD